MLTFGIVHSTIGDIIVETLYLTGVTLEQNNPRPLPLPSILSWGFCYFLQVAQTAAQHCMEGIGEGKLYFPYF